MFLLNQPEAVMFSEFRIYLCIAFICPSIGTTVFSPNSAWYAFLLVWFSFPRFHLPPFNIFYLCTLFIFSSLHLRWTWGGCQARRKWHAFDRKQLKAQTGQPSHEQKRGQATSLILCFGILSLTHIIVSSFGYLSHFLGCCRSRSCCRRTREPPHLPTQSILFIGLCAWDHGSQWPTIECTSLGGLFWVSV